MNNSDNYKGAASRAAAPAIDALADALIEAAGGIEHALRAVASRKPPRTAGRPPKYREGAQHFRVAWAVLREGRDLGEAIRGVTDENGHRIKGGSTAYKRLEAFYRDHKDEMQRLFD